MRFFDISVHICFTDGNSYCGKILQFSNCYPFMHISRSVNVKMQNPMFPLLYMSDVKHLCFWNIKPSYIIITIVTESADVRYILHHKLLVLFCLLRGMGVRSLSPNVNQVWSFLVVKRGLNCYFICHFTNLIFQAFQNTEMKCTKKLFWMEILAS